MTAWCVAQARASPRKAASTPHHPPLAIAAGDQALLVSGRAVRRGVLAPGRPKGPPEKMATRGASAGEPGQARRTGSRRWKQLPSQRRAEAGTAGGEAGRQPGRPSGDQVHGGQPRELGRDRQPHRIERKASGRRQNRRAQNMVTKLGHAPSEIARTEHRRVGCPARRDRRRHCSMPTRPGRTRAAAPSSVWSPRCSKAA